MNREQKDAAVAGVDVLALQLLPAIPCAVGEVAVFSDALDLVPERLIFDGAP